MQKFQTWGIIGVILYLLSYIPNASVFFILIGSVILIYAFWLASKYFSNDEIFTKFLFGMIIQAIATFLFMFKIAAVIFAVLMGAFSANPVVPVLGTIAIYFAVYYVLNIFGAFLIKESLSKLKDSTDISLFEYSGVMIILGAVLKVIAIGFLVEIIGWLMLIVAFLSYKEPITTQKDDDIIDVEVEEVKLIEEKN
ncbi:DUF996 domain-containing protein [Caminibacter pacificus]|jgi:uncharacterized membrane protein